MKVLSIFKKMSLIGLLASIFILLLSSCFLQMRTSDKNAKKEFEFSQKPLKLNFYSYKGRTIHYAEVGDKSQPTLLFIHGSPGSWDAFAGYLKDSSLQQQFHMIAVDRLGYGYSDFGKKEESVKLQAEVFRRLLSTSNTGKKTILIGHSYGGPVIARMAMDFPDEIGGLLFIAPSIDPDLEPKMWFQEPATWLVFRWMLPKALIVSNEEILALKNELINMLPMWEKITAPTIFLQGAKDVLVNPANAEFAQRKMTNANLKLMVFPEQNHFIPWTIPDTVKNALIKLSN